MVVLLSTPKIALVTIDIFYYNPDYQHIIQEFVWQLDDIVPELYKTHKFLNHWHQNIKATIQQILISGIDNDAKHSLRNVDNIYLV